MTRAVSPAAAGFRMPAEWEPHAATWLAWPHARGDWPGKFEPIPWVYGEVVRHLAPGERVRILVQDAATERGARTILRRVGVAAGRVDFYRIPTDRSWTRDSLPTFVRHADGRLGLVSWRFNAWAKYPNWTRDVRIGEHLARLLHLPIFRPATGRRRIVLEGGGIDTNGRGTLLLTEECFLSRVQARNPGLSRAAFERVLRTHLGVRTILWLGAGIAGDDTHGHVDDVARFVDPRTVALAWTDDRSDPNYAPLADNLVRLRRMRDQDGRKLRVVRLPMPQPLAFDGQHLPASYANFYVANGVVLVPTFNDPADRQALAILADLFPGRRVVGIHAVDLVWGLGTLHCMTQQEPI